MEFEWDNRKAHANLKRHGIDFSDVVGVFEDESAITLLDDHPYEDRFITLGSDSLGRILVVVYTWRGNRIRIISARKATSRERQQHGG